MSRHWDHQPRDSNGRWTSGGASSGGFLNRFEDTFPTDFDFPDYDKKDVATGLAVGLGAAYLAFAPQQAVFRTTMRLTELGIKAGSSTIRGQGGLVRRSISGTTRVTNAGPIRANVAYGQTAQRFDQSLHPLSTVIRGKSANYTGGSQILPGASGLSFSTRTSKYAPNSKFYDFKGSQLYGRRPGMNPMEYANNAAWWLRKKF